MKIVIYYHDIKEQWGKDVRSGYFSFADLDGLWWNIPKAGSTASAAKLPYKSRQQQTQAKKCRKTRTESDTEDDLYFDCDFEVDVPDFEYEDPAAF